MLVSMQVGVHCRTGMSRELDRAKHPSFMLCQMVTDLHHWNQVYFSESQVPNLWAP